MTRHTCYLCIWIFRLQRIDIAQGTACGLTYLHGLNPRKIIHGDIKSANILLDRHFEPKIGDFGLARGGSDDPNKSHRTITSVCGTSGYLPDDYLRSKQLSPAVDIFCFGMTLFDLVTGKNAYPKI